jgi:transposase
MSYICGTDRNQRLLLPESVEDYVAAENPVRAMEAFVASLDLGALGVTRSRPAETGRPAYDPGDLLRLYVWGYCNRVRSSRALERECQRNLEVIWLLRRLAPDFKTISDFRRDNRAALKGVFRQFVLLCRELGLFGRELIAIDGTKLQASNHVSHQGGAEQIVELLKGVEARIEEYLAALEQSETDLLGAAVAPVPEAGLARKLAALRQCQERYQQALAVAAESGDRAPLVDPECQRMQKVGLGYNAQIAVDAKHHLIAAAEIATEPTDHNQLPVVAEEAKAVLGVKEIKAVADRGYHSRSALAAAAEAGVETYVPRPRAGHAEVHGVFHVSAFVYEAEEDAYRCPAGQWLTRRGCYEKHGEVTYAYSNPAACKACPLHQQCRKAAYRRIERWEKETVLEQLEDRVARHPEIVAQRKSLVEHPFGTIKFWRGQGTLLTRGRSGAQAELSLSALAYNLGRVLAVLGVAGLVAALQARRSALGAVGARIGRLLAHLWSAWAAASRAPAETHAFRHFSALPV